MEKSSAVTPDAGWPEALLPWNGLGEPAANFKPQASEVATMRNRQSLKRLASWREVWTASEDASESQRLSAHARSAPQAPPLSEEAGSMPAWTPKGHQRLESVGYFGLTALRPRAYPRCISAIRVLRVCTMRKPMHRRITTDEKVLP